MTALVDKGGSIGCYCRAYYVLSQARQACLAVEIPLWFGVPVPIERDRVRVAGPPPEGRRTLFVVLCGP